MRPTEKPTYMRGFCACNHCNFYEGRIVNISDNYVKTKEQREARRRRLLQERDVASIVKYLAQPATPR